MLSFQLSGWIRVFKEMSIRRRENLKKKVSKTKKKFKKRSTQEKTYNRIKVPQEKKKVPQDKKYLTGKKANTEREI